jgi:integrase
VRPETLAKRGSTTTFRLRVSELHDAKKPPSYLLHKPSAQARVRINGRDVYLGEYDTEASQEAYHRIIAQWTATSGKVDLAPAAGRRRAMVAPCNDPTIAEVVVAYWQHCKDHYMSPEGERTSTLYKIKNALRQLRQLCGTMPASEFGAPMLETYQSHLIAADLARTTINDYTSVVRRMFRWAVSKRMVPALVLHELSAVDGLRIGRSGVREPDPVGPVPEETVLATIAHTSQIIADMIQLQLLSGARPGEVCRMTTGEIDASGPIWIYTPRRHKTAYRGKRRQIVFGPRAQAILGPYLRKQWDVPIFSPAEGEAQSRAARTAARKTPLSCGNRAGKGGKARRKRAPGNRYTVNSYRRAIWRACDRTFPPPPELRRQKGERKAAWLKRLDDEGRQRLAQWRKDRRWHPNQLRHTRATEVRKTFGIEAAGAILGHSKLSTTEIYAEKNLAQATEVALKIG